MVPDEEVGTRLELALGVRRRRDDVPDGSLRGHENVDEDATSIPDRRTGSP
jgi:hypothetical protein